MTMVLQVSQQGVSVRLFKLPGIKHVRFVLFLFVRVLSSALPRPPLLLPYTLTWFLICVCVLSSGVAVSACVF